MDEAYHEYALAVGVPDATRWLDRFPNLVVTRTFSKAYGLAGIRVGYCLSSVQVADVLNRVRQPFNVNSLAQSGAETALADRDFIAASVRSNQAGLEQLGRGFEALGLGATPSAGNFMLVELPVQPELAYEGMLRRGVIVRPVGNYGLDRHLRITVGTPGQNERMLTALGEVLGERAP
ncbi:MAG: aminotransferase class I/II-fold pyridoxal phosphate-dependent enzyme [Gammaproteobacteria bacterium]|nr:aminotransferase class I/II-fold pyridoxal phosphate-dependent enzyme [Gammaproteobacteria bacterium]